MDPNESTMNSGPKAVVRLLSDHLRLGLKKYTVSLLISAMKTRRVRGSLLPAAYASAHLGKTIATNSTR